MTDITVAQAAIIEDHVWALMEALGVRDSRAVNQRISEAIGTVLDRQRDALPEQVAEASIVECERTGGAHVPKTFHERALPLGADDGWVAQSYVKCLACGARL